MLQVKGLTFHYPDNTEVFNNLNFTLKKGNILAIVGPSGSGKTTLLNLIYGLLAPTSGDVFWNKELVPNPKDVLIPGYDKMKLVAQDFDLMPFIKVFENMQQHILHLQEDERKPILDEWLSFLQIQHIESKKAKDLSGGQKQRVAIAKAFISNPELILLDEPFSNLDTLTKSFLISDLKALLKQKKTTAIVVVHQPEDALEIADEIIVVNEGRIEQQASPKKIYNQPNNKTVTSLFGLSNFFTSSEIENLLNINSNDFSVIQNEFVIRPHQLPLSKVKAKYTISDELFKGSSTLLRIEAGGREFWVTKD
jgi:ABC-type sugar transport system ATPase subunit